MFSEDNPYGNKQQRGAADQAENDANDARARQAQQAVTKAAAVGTVEPIKGSIVAPPFFLSFSLSVSVSFFAGQLASLSLFFLACLSLFLWNINSIHIHTLLE
jgi:hypothetical protein